MYSLTFSYYSSSDPVTIKLLDTEGEILGSALVLKSFHKADWHCYLLSLENGFQGFVEFANTSDTPAIFAINPQEFETNPVEGSGGELRTFVIRSMAGAIVPNAAVYVTNDIDGMNVIAGRKYTDVYGKVTFHLNNGTYYIWREHDSFTFSNPRTVIL